MEIALSDFLAIVDGVMNVWLPARTIVETSIQQCAEGSEILLLSTPCPWKGHLFDIEKELGCCGRFKYVVFKSSDSSFRCYAVPVAPSSFTSRKALPESWRGVRGEELVKLSGVKDCIFVHATGFLGGTTTEAAALAMAEKALA